MLKKNMKIAFRNFRIREVFAKDSREPGASNEKSGVMEFAPEVSFGCLTGQTVEPFHVLVAVKVSANLKKNKKNLKNASAAAAFIEGEAKFDISGVSLEEFRQIFEDMDFLDRIADQVYPLVTTRLVRLLGEMGFRTEVPLSLPEVESRTKLSDVIENEKETPIKSLKRKSIKNV